MGSGLSFNRLLIKSFDLFLIKIEGSIEDINKRLVADSDPNGCVQIDARNFRPNIVVSGVPAFDEVIHFKF